MRYGELPEPPSTTDVGLQSWKLRGAHQSVNTLERSNCARLPALLDIGLSLPALQATSLTGLATFGALSRGICGAWPPVHCDRAGLRGPWQNARVSECASTARDILCAESARRFIRGFVYFALLPAQSTNTCVLMGRPTLAQGPGRAGRAASRATNMVLLSAASAGDPVSACQSRAGGWVESIKLSA
jgi:hypothetical protein